ncbi:MAG TPA: DnaJ domain-containing protein [Gaiellaceae bacterium]|nr:DnaJ domain-containing protein [Gaiellaceae bacterium]
MTSLDRLLAFDEERRHFRRERNMAERQRHLYDVLGVEPEADAVAIRRAFRARARELHPDVSTDADAAARFAEVSRAYAVLSRPTARLLYDRIGYLGPGNGGFEDRPRGGEAHEDRRKPFGIAEIEVEVEAVEAARGRRRRVDVASVGPCPACGGSGARRGAEVVKCAACGGEGSVRRSLDAGSARVLQVERCPLCAGDGRIVAAGCVQCSGTGTRRRVRKLVVRIPPGSSTGDRLAAEGDGDVADDVFVVLRVKPDRDSAAVRYAAAAALVLAVTLFVVVALIPDAVAGGP